MLKCKILILCIIVILPAVGFSKTWHNVLLTNKPGDLGSGYSYVTVYDSCSSCCPGCNTCCGACNSCCAACNSCCPTCNCKSCCPACATCQNCDTYGPYITCQNSLATCQKALTAALAANAALPCCLPPAETQPKLDISVFTNNGKAMAVFGAGLTPYLLKKSTQDFGYALYREGRKYSGGKVEVIDDARLSIANIHNAAYCSKNLNAEKPTCKATLSGVSAADVKYLEMGDIKFSSMLSPTTYSQATELVAQQLIRNLTKPIVGIEYTNSIADPSFMKRGDYKSSYAKYLINHAVLGVAFYSLNNMYGMRASGTTLGTTPATSSVLSIMEDEAVRRFEKPDFAKHLNDPTTTELDILKHMAAMEAFSMWMDYQHFRQDERMEALLATGLAKLVLNSAEQQKLMKTR